MLLEEGIEPDGGNLRFKEMSLLNIDRYFGEVVESADVLRAWAIG
jgi:hypothetical protein